MSLLDYPFGSVTFMVNGTLFFFAWIWYTVSQRGNHFTYMLKGLNIKCLIHLIQTRIYVAYLMLAGVVPKPHVNGA